MIFDDSGKLVWEYKNIKCVDVSVLPNGNILMCHESPKASWVREVERETQKTVWEYKIKGEAQSCQRLANGNTVIGLCTTREVIEVSADKKIVHRIRVKTNATKAHKVLRRVRKGEDGLYYVAHHGEGVCRVYNSQSEIVRELPHYPGYCYSATPLKDGHVLLTGKDLVKIIDENNAISWQLKPEDIPSAKIASFCGAHLLDNGNLVISNWLGHGKDGTGDPVVEISPDKKVLWRFSDTQQTKHVLGVQVLN